MTPFWINTAARAIVAAQGARMSEIALPEPAGTVSLLTGVISCDLIPVVAWRRSPEPGPVYTAEQVRQILAAERGLVSAMQTAWKTQLGQAGLPEHVASKIVDETCASLAAAIRKG